jgi:hypothetical protein
VFELDELVGLRVSQISFGSGVTLDLRGYADRSGVAAKLDAGPIKYESADGSTVELDASETRGNRYAPLLALYGSEIKAARADENANVLELVFENGDRFTALPMTDVEGWQLAGPGNRFMVAVPGGEIAAWE